MMANASPNSFGRDQFEFSTKRMFSLQRHRLRHTKKKPLKRTECSFVTKWRQSIVKHLRKHNKIPTEAELDDEKYVEIDQTKCAEELIVTDPTKELIKCKEVPYDDCISVNSSSLEGFQFINQIDGNSNDVPETTATEVVSGPQLLNVENHDPLNMCTPTIISEALPCPELIFWPDIVQPQVFTAVLPCLDVLKADNFDKFLKCEICSYKATSPLDLRRHKLTHEKPILADNEKSLECEICSFKTIIPCVMRRHKLLHAKPVLECGNCNFKTKSQSNLQRHHLLKHLEDNSVQIADNNTPIIEYENCSYKTKRPLKWRRHKPILECKKCSYKTKNKSDLRLHKQSHPKPILECKKCSYKTKSPTYLQRHKQTHPKPILECKKCSYKTKNQSDLRRHKRTHAKPKADNNKIIFECKDCSFKTKRAIHFRCHNVMHAELKADNNKPILECDKCFFKTKYPSQLRRHKLAHAKPIQDRKKTILQCEICFYLAKYPSQLLRHKLTHAKPIFECEFCSYKTKTPSFWLRHNLTHAKPIADNKKTISDCAKSPVKQKNVEEIKCSHCSYVTNCKGNIRKHLLKHLEVNNWEFKTDNETIIID